MFANFLKYSILISGSSPPKVNKANPERPISVLSSRSSQIRSFSPFRGPIRNNQGSVYGSVTVHNKSQPIQPVILSKYRSGIDIVFIMLIFLFQIR